MSEPPPLPSRKPPTTDSLSNNAGMRMIMPIGRSGWAIAAGYLGLFSITLVFAPFALIVSLIAIADIRKSKQTDQVKHGLGRAIFGLIMGLLFSIVLGFGIYAMVTSG